MHYYICTKNGDIEVTEVEYMAFLGSENIRPYASKVYRGELSIDEVSEDIREEVSSVVAKRIEWLGEYQDPIDEIALKAQAYDIITGVSE